MRFHLSVLNAILLGSSEYGVRADPCDDVCHIVKGLCDPAKGSWCNNSGACQNLFMTKDSDLCFLTPQNPCANSQAVKCDEAMDKLREKILFDEARRLAREVPEHLQPRLGIKIDFPPPEEFGSACVIC